WELVFAATNLRRDSLQNQAIAQAVANLFMARLLPNSEISEPELLSRLKLVAVFAVFRINEKNISIFLGELIRLLDEENWIFLRIGTGDHNDDERR
ncbi:MAG: hypothetical protein D3908_01040, partial [Candidatus Electrothrix sp. AUS4]|nr:hypothetical protein [Candidatus Electrothrix sp. AUS4]